MSVDNWFRGISQKWKQQCGCTFMVESKQNHYNNKMVNLLMMENFNIHKIIVLYLKTNTYRRGGGGGKSNVFNEIDKSKLIEFYESIDR